MVYSMTGFGSSQNENKLLKVDTEIKSLNSKFLDLNIRLPKLAQPFEMEFRNIINQRVKRGKVQLNMNIQVVDHTLAKRPINGELFSAYVQELRALGAANQLDDSQMMQVVMSLPDVLEMPESEEDETLKAILIQSLNDAIDGMVEFRKQEGQNLQNELESYVEAIAAEMGKVDASKEERIEKMRKRLFDLQEKYLTSEQKDSNRFEQEVVFYIERFDITEELVRLDGHLKYFLSEMKSSGSGKKLGFIAQEMGREINTLGSKANDKEIQHLVVHMKDNLEKIKEQVLNIL